jgi:hypothetical protein
MIFLCFKSEILFYLFIFFFWCWCMIYRLKFWFFLLPVDLSIMNICFANDRYKTRFDWSNCIGSWAKKINWSMLPNLYFCCSLGPWCQHVLWILVKFFFSFTNMWLKRRSLQKWPVGFQCRIVHQHPLACHKGQLNGDPRGSGLEKILNIPLCDVRDN